MAAIETSRRIAVEVNGVTYEREVESRRLLIHFLRDDLDLTGSHIGCDTGNCGACSVILDGVLVKSCMLLAVQADGASIRTVEGLADGRRALRAAAGVQRPPRAAVRLLHAGHARAPRPPCSSATRGRASDEIRKGLQGNICRCTGYWNIVDAVQAASGQEDGDMTETVVAPERVEAEAPAEPKPWQGQSIPRKEDRRLVQGQGVFVDDIKRHNMGFAHYVRSPYAHAVISRSTSRRRSSCRACSARSRATRSRR